MEVANRLKRQISNLLCLLNLLDEFGHVLGAKSLDDLTRFESDRRVIVQHDFGGEIDLLNKVSELCTFEEERPSIYHFHELFQSKGMLIDAGPSIQEIFVQNEKGHLIIVVAIRYFFASIW